MADKAKGGKAKNPWIIAAVVGMAAFMEVLDISIANVALLHISGSLSSTPDESTWILTSYLVTNAVILLMSGWLSTFFGRKRYFVMCIAGFGVSSFLCGMAPTLALLITFRALQGLIGGGLQPVAQAILADAFPPEKQGMAFSVYGLAVVFAPAIGPTLGGWITDNYTWCWVFLINVPVSLILTFLATSIISPDEEKKKKRGFSVDYIGFILLSCGIGAMQVVLDRGQIDDWFDARIIVVLTIVAALGLISFVVWELITSNPLIDLSLLKNANFAFGSIIMLIFGAVLLSSTVLLPEFGQEVLGYTATIAGETISLGGIFLAMLMPIIGILLTKVDTRLIIGCGLIICILSLLFMTNFDQQIDFWTIAQSRIFQCAGLGFLFIPINTLAFQGIPKDKTNAASAIINMMRNVGGSIGISLVTTVLERRQQVHQAYLTHNITASSANYQSAISHLQPYLLSHVGSSFDALQKTQAVLNRTIDQQALVLAYLDDFQLLALIFLIMLPLLFFVKKPQPNKGQPRAD